jgi:hypothetical protein
MEYINQRWLLRRPRCYEFNNTWDRSDLDGGCEVWRRFKENRLLALKNSLLSQMGQGLTAGPQLEQSRRQDMAADLLRDRLSSSIDQGEWSVGSKETYNQNTCAVVDGDGNDSDDDDAETIYTQSRSDPVTANRVFSDASRSSSSSSLDSYVTVPAPAENLNLPYVSFNWTDDVEESTGSVEEATVAIQPAQNMAIASNDTQSLNISSQSESNPPEAELAFWISHQRESNRTLGSELPDTPSSLTAPMHDGYCAWKHSPLPCSFSAHEMGAMNRGENGRCPSDRVPLLILTDEVGDHFLLVEVIRVLSEQEISDRLKHRADAEKQYEAKEHPYNDNDPWSEAEREFLTAAECLTIDIAKAWWSTEQKKRDSTYRGWKQEAANERALLEQQIKQEVHEYFVRLEEEKAAENEQQRLASVLMAQMNHLAALMRKLERDGLQLQDNGLLIGDDYSVKLTDKVLDTICSRQPDIEANMLRYLASEETFEERLAARVKKDEQKAAGIIKLWKVKQKRKLEMQMRRLDIFAESEQEVDLDYNVPNYHPLKSRPPKKENSR